jgi:class 3 adenylate cyclase/tetratricopeptide (TPR) repeat protein
MRCPSCQQANRPGARFCDACGTRLGDAPAARPATPVRSADPRAYTPPHLADRILTSRAALVGERKQVTVLFADVQESMVLAEQMDPEAWHAVLDGFFTILLQGVHRFEGTVNQFTGDGIMALFGAPLAHEDHAARACYAALALQDQLSAYAAELRRTRGLNFAVRMGLNSGEVIVGAIGDDLRMDYTAQGQTVNLAARMEQLAEPGKIYVTEETATLVRGYFQLEDLGAFDVKGARDSVRVFELQDVGALRTRLEVSQARGLSRFVGRADETAALEAALARAEAGEANVVGVVGEPGVGKSRLCYEFVERCRARGLPVAQAHAVAYGQMVPFLPVLELMRSFFGITEKDDDREARRKIAGTLVLLEESMKETLPAVVELMRRLTGGTGAPEDALRAALPLVFEFLGVPDPERPAPRMDPEARRRQLFTVMKRLAHARTRKKPAVVLLEDLHWLDGGSESFLANLVDALPGSRLLLVVNFRPEYRAAWMEKPYYRRLPLLPLAATASAELLRSLLGQHASLDGLADRIAARTGGNPFFIEEVVQALVEAGNLDGTPGAYRLVSPIDTVAIPPTVQAVLAARIDRLGERDKGVLQTAAVIGKRFPEAVLARVCDLPADELAAALRALTAADFVYEDAPYPEAEYAFKHRLTQEVAYGSQLAERRARVHGAVARAVVAQYPGRLNERAALLARHWEGAGDVLEAARWRRRAAEWAGGSDPEEALRHWQKVRAHLADVAESPETLDLGATACAAMLNLGWRLGTCADEATALFVEGSALAKKAGSTRTLALLHVAYGSVRGAAGSVESGHRLTVEAARIAADADDPALRLAMRARLALAHFHVGRLADSLEVIELGLAESGDDVRLGTDLLGYSPFLTLVRLRGQVLGEIARLDEATTEIERAMALARAQDEVEGLAWSHMNAVRVALYRGDGDGALAHARHMVEVAERVDTPYIRTQAYLVLGQAHGLREEWADAARLLEEGLALAREHRTGLQLEALFLASVAEAYLGLGRQAAARTAVAEALDVARAHGTRLWECLAQLAAARVAVGVGEPGFHATAARALDQADQLATAIGARSQEPFLQVERARLARLTGDHDAARKALREARRQFGAMGATGHVSRLARASR